MIKHVVMWRFAETAEGRTREENLDIVRDGLQKLPPIIPEIKSLEIGRDVLRSEMSYDMVLLMEFESMDALAAYQNHPEHKKVSAYVGKVREARAVVDFIVA